MTTESLQLDPSAMLLIGFSPGLFWAWQLFRRLRGRTEPVPLLARTFLLGVLAAIPIAIVEEFVLAPAKLGERLGMGRTEPLMAAYTAFAVAGVCEEIGKFLIVRYSLGRSPYLRDRVAGMMFAACAALGFASIENVLYMHTFGWQVIYPRAVLSTLGHVLFSLPWGYGLGAASAAWIANGRVGYRSALPSLLGLCAAIALHGAFDYFLFLERADSHTWALLVWTLGLVAGVALWQFGKRRTRDRYRRAPKALRCQTCNHFADATDRNCPSCSTPIDLLDSFVCGSCMRSVEWGWAYCGGCGSRMLRAATPDEVAELNRGKPQQLMTVYED